MNEYKKEKAAEKKARIFEVVKAFGRPVKSTEVYPIIKDILYKEVKDNLDAMIVEGIIPSRENETSWNKLWVKNGIGLRQVQRYLQELTKEGFLLFKLNRYTVSDVDYPEIKLRAKDWGSAMLFSAMKMIYPHYRTLEYNFPRLVQIFGVYVVYCLIEAARHIKNPDNKKISARRTDQLALSWIENALDPNEMFQHFIAFAKSQLSDQEVEHIRKKIFVNKNGKPKFVGTLEDLGRNVPHFQHRMISIPLRYPNRREYNKPLFKIDQTRLNSLKEMLKSKYYDEYMNLENTYNVLLVTNMEGVSPPGPPTDYSNLGDDL